MFRSVRMICDMRRDWPGCPLFVWPNHTLTNLLFLLYFLNKRLTIGGLFPWYQGKMGKNPLCLPAILSFMPCRPAWAGVTEQTDNGYRLEGTYE